MNRAVAYFTFNGNCREAMQFYQSCLGGELSFQTLGESPGTHDLPRQVKECILHATLRSNGITIMGSDMVGEESLYKGNSISVFVVCDNEQELYEYYQRLSIDCLHSQPIVENMWSGQFGSLTDKYGYSWLFHCQSLDKVGNN